MNLGIKAPALLHVDTKSANLGVDCTPGRDDSLALNALLDELERPSRCQRRSGHRCMIEDVSLKNVLLSDQTKAGAENDIPNGNDWQGLSWDSASEKRVEYSGPMAHLLRLTA